MHPKSFFVNWRSQLKEEHRPKKLSPMHGKFSLWTFGLAPGVLVIISPCVPFWLF
jgi:hypothetical protein